MTIFYHMKHPLKTKKVKKPKAKGAKADSIEKVTVAELIPQLENTQFHLDEQPYASLFKIYKKEFMDVSVSKNLFHPDSLALAGDGTPVVTSHRERKNESVTARKMELQTANATAIFHSPTVISAGILLVPAGITVMICICLLIHKVTFLYSLISLVPQRMIHMVFYRHFLE